MAGIVFLRTNDLKKTKEFYTNTIGATVWVEQKDCTILRHGNFIFGFCQREGEISPGWLLTFFYKTTEEVDEMYNKIKDLAITKPLKSDEYRIYQFYAKDLDGRDLEFQTFLHKIDFDWKIYEGM